MSEAVETKPWYKSKAKIGAILAAVGFAIEVISDSWGSPIRIPEWVYDLLQGFGISLGIYGVRDSIKK